MIGNETFNESLPLATEIFDIQMKNAKRSILSIHGQKIHGQQARPILTTVKNKTFFPELLSKPHQQVIFCLMFFFF